MSVLGTDLAHPLLPEIASTLLQGGLLYHDRSRSLDFSTGYILHYHHFSSAKKILHSPSMLCTFSRHSESHGGYTFFTSISTRIVQYSQIAEVTKKYACTYDPFRQSS